MKKKTSKKIPRTTSTSAAAAATAAATKRRGNKTESETETDEREPPLSPHEKERPRLRSSTGSSAFRPILR